MTRWHAIEPADVGLLRCPACGGDLALRGRAERAGILRCMKCAFCARERDDGLFDLHVEERVRGTDRVMRRVYDAMPVQHDIGVRFALPLMQDGVTEATLRARFLRPLALERLRARPDGEPVRILEVGMGTGSNLPEILARIPRDVPVELWGCDLSRGMLRRARRRLERWGLQGTDGRAVRIVGADAHALPFAAGAFDRVFHVGGIGVFRDRGLAMREMTRVARPDAIVLVADECLDPSRWHSPLHRFWFWQLTALDRAPHPPRAEVPVGSSRVDLQACKLEYSIVSPK